MTAIGGTQPTPDPERAAYAAQVQAFLAQLPADMRPRILTAPETPAADVLDYLVEWQGVQPLRRLDGGTLEVLFTQLPTDTTLLSQARDDTGLDIRPAIVDPLHPELFDVVAAAARSARGADSRWIERILDDAYSLGASDVRLGAGDHPIVKVPGKGWQRLAAFEPATDTQLAAAASWAAGRPFGDVEGPVDDDVSADHDGRHLRINIYRERGHLALSLRVIPAEPLPFPALGLPESVAAFSEFRSGLVLVTGVTGSGKSTTLAALIDMINDRDPLAIQTIEDPIEYIHEPKKASIHQREVGRDTASFTAGMLSALRQNPDIILLGEIRSYEEIATAIRAAETGHLVFATLHTSSAAATITRLVDVFPAEQQNQVRVQLASTLRAVCCQRLLPRIDQPDRWTVVSEVMFVNDPIAAIIKNGSTQQILSHIIDGRRDGMVAMDEALAEAVVSGRIADQTARDYVSRPQTYQSRLDQLLRQQQQ